MKTTSMPNVTFPDAALGAFEAGDQKALHCALCLSPWIPSPLIAESPYPPAWVTPGGSWAKDWQKAWELRQALQQVA